MLTRQRWATQRCNPQANTKQTRWDIEETKVKAEEVNVDKVLAGYVDQMPEEDDEEQVQKQRKRRAKVRS